MDRVRLDVVGDPIEHSKSPYIHTTVAEELGIPCEYGKVKVERGKLAEYIENVKADGICGFNLTMPHKQDIIPYLDFIDKEAQLFNSVNTVKVKDGKLIGYNTDANGLVWAMREKGFSPNGKNILILGAGGVVFTAALKLAMEGAKKITVLNRTITAAATVAEMVREKAGADIQIGELNNKNINDAAKQCDILINGTPLGMAGVEADFQDLSFLKWVKTDALVFDLIYNPEETNLLKAAKEFGINTLNGYGMLIYQGLLADEIFLDRELNLAYLKQKIEDKIKNLKKFKKYLAITKSMCYNT